MNVREKGHAYERKIAKELRKRGYDKCRTSREESRYLDSLKVDLTNTGDFYIQCKAQERGIYPHVILNEMPKKKKINLLFHKRNRKGEVVSMTKEDFYKLLEVWQQSKH